jgi:phosphatidylserine/phosphatidylglycerophosphate/cardiolipin synthase-like enzyme
MIGSDMILAQGAKHLNKGERMTDSQTRLVLPFVRTLTALSLAFSGVTVGAFENALTEPSTGPSLSGAEPKNHDVCFSPAESCDQKLIAFLGSARKRIDIAIYSFTHRGILQALIDAKNRGVAIRMIADRSQSTGVHSELDAAREAGIEVKIGNVRGIMHDKFTLVDSQRLETGSFNYTAGATAMNAENQVYLFDGEIVARFSKNFEALWADGLAQ